MSDLISPPVLEMQHLGRFDYPISTFIDRPNVTFTNADLLPTFTMPPYYNHLLVTFRDQDIVIETLDAITCSDFRMYNSVDGLRVPPNAPYKVSINQVDIALGNFFVGPGTAFPTAFINVVMGPNPVNALGSLSVTQNTGNSVGPPSIVGTNMRPIHNPATHTGVTFQTPLFQKLQFYFQFNRTANFITSTGAKLSIGGDIYGFYYPPA